MVTFDQEALAAQVRCGATRLKSAVVPKANNSRLIELLREAEMAIASNNKTHALGVIRYLLGEL
jgi:hypothetical protein